MAIEIIHSLRDHRLNFKGTLHQSSTMHLARVRCNFAGACWATIVINLATFNDIRLLHKDGTIISRPISTFAHTACQF
jgi:hypothetical protein